MYVTLYTYIIILSYLLWYISLHLIHTHKCRYINKNKHYIVEQLFRGLCSIDVNYVENYVNLLWMEGNYVPPPLGGA